MGVYIKGMEIPESCLECPFKWAGDSTTYCLAQTPTMKSLMPVKLHEIRWKKFNNAVEKFRWKEVSCPLVPAADVRPVVLCRDCKWYQIDEFKKDGTEDRRYKPSVCVLAEQRRDPNHFCADGEKREE